MFIGLHMLNFPGVSSINITWFGWMIFSCIIRFCLQAFCCVFLWLCSLSVLIYNWISCFLRVYYDLTVKTSNPVFFFAWSLYYRFSLSLGYFYIQIFYAFMPQFWYIVCVHIPASNLLA